MTATAPFLTGVIEGFYGRSWPWSARLAFPAYLQNGALNTYIYCPKDDPHLRRNWQQDWPAAQRRQLVSLGERCDAADLFWGVGLSPYELYKDYSSPNRRALCERIEQITALGGGLLAVLFDDMPGDIVDLAERQAEIVADIVAWQPALRLIVCPTYYSFDPVLERHFGPRPSGYWERLGEVLPDDVDIFWTGNEVCSESISADDVSHIVQQLGRPVVLWDNYPVNDGANRSKHLYLRPLSNRDRIPNECLRGHLCNPMNQPLLSLYGLSGLTELYSTAAQAQRMRSIPGLQISELLQRDADFFQTAGLQNMDIAKREALAQEYASTCTPAGREVSDWLRGEYAFDPACLTD